MTERAISDAENGEFKSAREDSRESMMLMATLSGAAMEQELRTRVRNLSAGGMMVEMDQPLRRGASVVVTLPRIGDVTATVAWARAGRVGFKFDHPIDPARARRPVGGGESSPVYAKALTVGPRALRVR